MDLQAVIEGDGIEIARYVQDHPQQRYRLIVLEAAAIETTQHGPGSKSWDELLRVIDSFRGQYGSMPPNAASTEGLYPY